MTQPVPPTTTPLVTPWTASPIFKSVPSDPHTPTGSGLDSDVWTTPTAPAALPWGTAAVPALPTTVPRTYWRFDPKLDLRKVSKTRSGQTSGPSRSSSTTAPTPPSSLTAPAPPAPVATRLVIAPVRLKGVPGGSRDGVNTVSVDINKHFP